MAADILGPVALARISRARYILVMSDMLTKYAVTVALKEMTVATVANAILDEWIKKFGAQDVIHTDQGTNFNTEVMQDICRIFLIEKTRTTPFIPKEMGRSRDLIKSLPARFQSFVLKNYESGMCIYRIKLLCITPPFTELSERRLTPRFSRRKRNTP